MLSKIREYMRQSKNIEKDENFYEIYKELESEILNIENNRKKSVLKIIAIYITIIMISILYVYIMIKVKMMPILNLIYVLSTIIIMIRSTIRYINEKNDYINKYKSDLLIRILNKITNNTVYFSKQRNRFRRLFTSWI